MTIRLTPIHTDIIHDCEIIKFQKKISRLGSFPLHSKWNMNNSIVKYNFLIIFSSNEKSNELVTRLFSELNFRIPECSIRNWPSYLREEDSTISTNRECGNAD